MKDRPDSIIQFSTDPSSFPRVSSVPRARTGVLIAIVVLAAWAFWLPACAIAWGLLPRAGRALPRFSLFRSRRELLKKLVADRLESRMEIAIDLKPVGVSTG